MLTDLVKNYGQTIRDEFPSSTASLIVLSPIKAISEKASQMSDLVSIVSRVAAVPVSCIEIPTLLFGRKIYHGIVGVTERSTQKRTEMHDKLYALIMTATLNPTYYYFVGGEKNGWKMAGATIIGSALNMLLMKPMLYIMDVAKDLMGYQTIQESRTKRGIPKESSNTVQKYIHEKSLEFEFWLSEKSTTAKKVGLAFMIAGSVAATSSVYVVSSYIHQNTDRIGSTGR